MDFAGFIWLIGFVIGHIATLSYSLNWWYGQRLPHSFLAGMRQVHGLLVGGGCLGLAWALWGGYLPGRVFASNASLVDEIVGGYVLYCVLVGYVVLPIISAYRLLRPRPRAFVEQQSVTLDVTKKLGFKPVGHGRYRLLARLPFNQAYQVEFTSKVFRVAGPPGGLGWPDDPSPYRHALPWHAEPGISPDGDGGVHGSSSRYPGDYWRCRRQSSPPPLDRARFGQAQMEGNLVRDSGKP